MGHSSTELKTPSFRLTHMLGFGQTVSIVPISDNHGFEIDGESAETALFTVETLPKALTAVSYTNLTLPTKRIV